MHTDDLLEDIELDRALRELLPPMPRSRSWERAQRDDLLAYISSGAIRPTDLAERRRATLASNVQVHNGEAHSTRPIKALLVAAAGVAVIVASVALNSGRTEPVQGPESTIRPPLAVESLRPDRFPLLLPTNPCANAAIAMYGGQMSWENPPKAEALVARVGSDTITAGIALSVSAESFALPFGTTGAQTVTVAGTEMQLFVEEGTPVLTAVVLQGQGQPTFVAIGLDPIAFLEATGGFPITDVQVYSNGEVTFAISPLPAGYEVVVPQARLPLGSFDASLQVPDGDGGDGISVRVGVHNPLLSSATVGDLRRVDIDGVPGWLRDIGPGSTVAWPVSETTWATIGGATTADDALEFARSLTFVEETTWRARYGLEEPVYPTKDDQLAPPRSTVPEPTTMIISRSTTAVDDLEVTPVACAGNGGPHTENAVVDPAVSADAEMALRIFLQSENAGRLGRRLFSLGYAEIFVQQADYYRYERRNNVGDLVTVIFVGRFGAGWAVTHWQASAC